MSQPAIAELEIVLAQCLMFVASLDQCCACALAKGQTTNYTTLVVVTNTFNQFTGWEQTRNCSFCTESKGLEKTRYSYRYCLPCLPRWRIISVVFVCLLVFCLFCFFVDCWVVSALINVCCIQWCQEYKVDGCIYCVTYTCRATADDTVHCMYVLCAFVTTFGQRRRMDT